MKIPQVFATHLHIMPKLQVHSKILPAESSRSSNHSEKSNKIRQRGSQKNEREGIRYTVYSDQECLTRLNTDPACQWFERHQSTWSNKTTWTKLVLLSEKTCKPPA